MQQQQAEKSYKKAIRLHQSGRFKEAEVIYRRILKAFPKLDPIHSNLGAVLYAQGNNEAALRSLEKALKLNPTNMDAYVNRAAVLKAMGNLEESVKAYRQIAEIESGSGAAHYNLANVLVDSGDFDGAEKAYAKAINVDPGLYQAFFNSGMLAIRLGRTDHAEERLRKALGLKPDYPQALVNFGNLLADTGRTDEAAKMYDSAIEALPDYSLAYRCKGKLLLDLQQSAAALEVLVKGESVDGSDPDLQILKGNALSNLGRQQEARAAYEAALALDPENKGARENLDGIERQLIPGWHLTMLADEARNSAYQKAIENAVSDGDQVLDIGTGSGLLSMMAARAADCKVTAVEMVDSLAMVAREVIKANGYDDRIDVLSKHSTNIVPGVDMPEKADLIISEILDSVVIGEGVLASMRHALKNLAKPGAKVIPQGAKVIGQLLALPERRKVHPVRELCGFDLSVFGRFRAVENRVALNLSREEHSFLSEAFPIRDFDFSNPPMAVSDTEPEVDHFEIPITKTGTVHGMAMWFELQLDAEIMASSGPEGRLKHWGQAIFFFRDDFEVKEGEKFGLVVERHELSWKLIPV